MAATRLADAVACHPGTNTPEASWAPRPCGGAGHWLFGKPARSRDDFVKFLVDDEGLKASHALMNQWFDHNNFYSPEHSNILIGPLREDQHEYLKSISFFVNPTSVNVRKRKEPVSPFLGL